MPNSNSRSLIWRIRENVSSMSTSERRLAKVMLDFPGDIAGYSASELAKMAHVSNATVTRFIRKLGYASYEGARRSVRAEHQAGSPLFLARSRQSAPVGSIAAHVEQSLNNIESTFRGLIDDDLSEIAKQIVAARKVWVMGYRASHGLANYFRWQIYQVVPGAALIPGPGETLAETIAAIDSKDIIVVFALRRQVSILPAFLEHVRRIGAKTVVISNHRPSGKLPADWTLPCHSQAPGPLDNHVAALAVLHILATRVIEQAGVAGRRRLATIETFHEALGELRLSAPVGPKEP